MFELKGRLLIAGNNAFHSEEKADQKQMTMLKHSGGPVPLGFLTH